MAFVPDPTLPDYDLFYSPEIIGQECHLCRKVRHWRDFDTDTSMRSGHKLACRDCLSSPCLSLEEHTIRMREGAANSHGVRKQRHEDQAEFRKHDEREGKRLHTSELLLRLQRLVPTLFVKEGGIVGDLILYEVADQPQTKWEGRNYNYLGFVPFGYLCEYSRYKFDEKRDVMVRESERGWRTVLLRFIKAGLLTEDQCNKNFGYPSGQASMVWFKELHKYRNRKGEPRDIVQKMDTQNPLTP